jgi:hypothetical protein
MLAMPCAGIRSQMAATSGCTPRRIMTRSRI